MGWNKGDEVEYTRLTVPTEAIRIASLSDTYLTWIKKFSTSDEFMRKCVNNGVFFCIGPLRYCDKKPYTTLSIVEIAKIYTGTP